MNEQSTRFEDTYQYTSQKGDWVWLPNGKLGLVVDTEILCCGNTKKVEVVPVRAGRLKSFLYRLFNVWTFYDGQINDLEPANRLKNICSS